MSRCRSSLDLPSICILFFVSFAEQTTRPAS